MKGKGKGKGGRETLHFIPFTDIQPLPTACRLHWLGGYLSPSVELYPLSKPLLASSVEACYL